MKKNLSTRQPNVDIEKLSPDQLVRLSSDIGKFINTNLLEAKQKIQKVLDVYGLKLTLQYGLKSVNETQEEVVDAATTEEKKETE